MAEPGWTFSEKSFYLAEFRRRTLALALPDALSQGEIETLQGLLDEFAKNDTRIIVLTPHRSVCSALVPDAADVSIAGWVGVLWRRLRVDRLAGLLVPEAVFAARCRVVALQLRPARVVWLDPRGALRRANGARWSVMDTADLRAVRDEGGSHFEEADLALLDEIRRLLEGGVPAVNLCSVEDIASELFTYAGSGTFFTRERYMEVRWLGIDDFDAAADLIARGVDEGYLVPRTEADIEQVLSNGFGVFVEGRYLAGIGALVPFSDGRSAEIASLYTLTRFVGEGVGAHLVRFASEEGAKRGYASVFACTTSERVLGFFQRHGFEAVDRDSLPAEKWQDYAPERRARVHALRLAV